MDCIIKASQNYVKEILILLKFYLLFVKRGCPKNLLSKEENLLV